MTYTRKPSSVPGTEDIATTRSSAGTEAAPSRSTPEVPQAFERLLAELSARFVNIPASEVDEAIVDSLRRIADLLEVDRSLLLQFAGPPGDAMVTHSWAAAGIPGVPPHIVSRRFPWTLMTLHAGRPVVLRTLAELPAEANVDRASWQVGGVKSHLSMPLRVGGLVEGAIAFACLRRVREWPEPIVERVGMLADVLANALAHKRARESLDAAIAFESLVSGILAKLLTADRSQQDRVIEQGLGEMGRALDVERVTLWQRIGDAAEFVDTHRWRADGGPVPDASPAAAGPWISGQLFRGVVVRFTSPSDLPAEARSDLPGLLAIGVHGALAVPLEVEGAVVGALSFATARHGRTWPDDLVPRARLLGEVLAIMLARQAAERREQEAQAQAAHAARVGTMGVFAASLVHELTQPLAASLANAETASELLATASPDLAELRSTVTDIVADDRRLGELIQQLRRFLRRGEMKRVDLDVGELIGDLRRMIGHDAVAKSITFAFDTPDVLPTVLGDRVQIQQVVMNLVTNAFDAVAAADAGVRRVDVRAEPVDGGVAIEVADTGRGMDAATLARIFEPFYTTKTGGMGLGLSISRSIVATHGGSLSVDSVPGRGTTFRLVLPSRATREGTPVVERTALPAPGKGTIVVIDDDPSMRRALERQLNGAGYGVEVHESVASFLERAAATDPLCIISDVRLPGPSGLELQATLARAERALPIVFISAHGDVQMTAHALKAGAIDFLAKPFSKRELLEAVGAAVAKARALEATRAKRGEVERRYASLTTREREVLTLVADGLLNKVIADRLGTAEATVKIHRGRVMEKMRADSVADLVRMVESLKPSSTGRD